MIRALCFAIFAAATLPAMAADQLTTIRAGDTAEMRVGESQAIAFYTTDRAGMQLTMVFTDSEGEMLRSRVRLDDGQSHAITLDLGEDDPDGYRFTFRRAGTTVEMVGQEVSAPTNVAAR